MTQEAISELDMDVFAKHIGPYFSWLESKIESGWEQSEHVQKDVLREVRSTSTTMRARFILGVSRNDFTKEIERAVGLLELAKEAFPQESDELDAKIQQLTSGIVEKLGNDLLPAKYKSKNAPKVEAAETISKVEEPKTKAGTETPRTKIIMPEIKLAKSEAPKTKIVLEKKVEVPKTKVVFEKKIEVPEKLIKKKIEISKTLIASKPKVFTSKQKKAEKLENTAKPKLIVKTKLQKKERLQKKPSLFSRVIRGILYRGGI